MTSPHTPSTPRVLYVLTDGGQARLIERSADNGAYVTLDEVDGRGRLRRLHAEEQANPPARSYDPAGSGRHAVGSGEASRRTKEEFVADVAETAKEVLREGAYGGVFLVAPGRLMGPLRDHMGTHVPVAGTLDKDLTKIPNAELGKWLDHPLSL